MARDLHDGHIHPPSHFCGSNCPKHRPEGRSSDAARRDLGVYGDALNEWLFEQFNADVSKVVWLDEGRWLVADCEEPGLYIIEMYPARAVRDV